LMNLVPYMSFAKLEEMFGADEATIRGWVRNGVQEDKRKHNGKVSVYDKVEEQLYQSLLAKREVGNAVTANIIYKEMKTLIMNYYRLTNIEYDLLQDYAKYCCKKGQKYDKMLYMKSQDELLSFKSGNEVKLSAQEITMLRDAFLKADQKIVVINKDWLSRFTSKYNLSYRRITHLTSKTPQDLENDVLDFLSEIHKLRKENEIPPENILNFDEMAIFYDQIPSYTYDKKGTSHPLLKVSQLQKKRLTAGLTISSSGEKLRPMLIFKGSGTRINKLTNSHDFFVRKNENAWNQC